MKRYSTYIFTLLAASGCAIGCTTKQEKEFEKIVGTPAERQAFFDKAERGAEDFIEDSEGLINSMQQSVVDGEKKTVDS